MPNFRCENPALEKVLSDLYALVVEQGGYINDNVTVQEKQGDLSILSSLPPTNHDELIVIPDACLPRIKDFIITANNDEINAEPRTPDVSESHVMAMRLMMEIYNITNKLAKHQEASPWLALINVPSVMDKLYEARANAPKIKQYYEMYTSKKIDDLLIDSFIGSRTLALSSNGEAKSSSCLMPFIDFVNHYYASLGYQISNDKMRNISIRNYVPISGSQECTVHYSNLDALDCLLIYGFVDVNAPFVRSVPIQFHINEYSSIQVHANISPLYKEALPEPVKDLRIYIPFGVEGDDSVMQFTHLLIPGEYAPFALRRVLTFYIHGWKPGLDTKAVKEIVVNTETFIIKKNIEYYASLSSVMESIGKSYSSFNIMRSLKTLVDVQMNKLRQYQERKKSMG